MWEMYPDVTDIFLLGALSLTTVNGVSQFQPEWICWESGVAWVRQPLEEGITDMAYSPFLPVCHDFLGVCSGIFFLASAINVVWQYWQVFVRINPLSIRIPTGCSCLTAWKGCYSELKRQLVDAIYLVGREF